MNYRKLGLAILKGVSIYALLTWGWVCASILAPVTNPFQTASLSYYIPIPTDVVGITAFAISLITYILWEWLR